MVVNGQRVPLVYDVALQAILPQTVLHVYVSLCTQIRREHPCLCLCPVAPASVNEQPTETAFLTEVHIDL
jgi:hypothetical protein